MEPLSKFEKKCIALMPVPGIALLCAILKPDLFVECTKPLIPFARALMSIFAN